ncbi:MAG TPA: helicase-associated domain-containing protein [Pseudonocardia sp.]|uniref:helicase-associated domain-containing protein n=1 Tax=Pseudonocardia sp. TaxID=60912 RepID=UPI002C0D2DA7|nr:helicase-associated domain-containing protein [Pseudonocardia sp.]HTF51262.1 helicase-associated domain-containing protein [Pseudonocardia sp.]
MAARSGKAPSGKLSGWLGSLPEGELTGLLRARPDTLLPPQPRTFGELANRLSTPHSVRSALDSLTAAGLVLLEGVRALGGEANPERVHQLFGGPAALPLARLTDQLTQLRRLALVWPNGERLATPGMLGELMPSPLALGRPARALLGHLTVQALRRIGGQYGLAGLPDKAAWVTALSAAIGDPDTAGNPHSHLSPAALELADEVARHGPRVSGVYLPSAYGAMPVDGPEAELALIGWLIPDTWGHTGEMPREVALALRGPDYHLRLPAPPTLPAGGRAEQGQLLAAAQGAAAATIDGLSRLLALLSHAPLATVQAGGVGTRELRRVGKELRSGEHEVRLWLEAAAQAGLVAVQGGAVLPTEEAEKWRHAGPTAAWVALLAGWWALPVTPTYRVDIDGKSQPALGGRLSELNANRLRADLLDIFADAGAWTRVPDLDAVIGLLAWRRPLAYGDVAILRRYATAAHAEFRALGLIADDALTPFGRALRDAARTDDPPAALVEAVADLLPSPAGTATFLPDLTAIVSGAASVELAALLDGCADAEARDVASTWRFSPSSVRRALDAGHPADGLLAALAAVADNALPQPLSYLIHDVARRHGNLRVRAVECCVCVPDQVLATEIAQHRALAALKLTKLADTVLSSAKPVAETLAALRRAGYAPVQEDAEGQTVVERAPIRTAKAPQRTRRSRPPGPPPAALLGPEQLASVLCRAGQPTDRPVSAQIELALPGFVASAVLAQATQLTPGEMAILSDAIERRHPVRIDYLSGSDRMTSRVVDPIDLEHDLLTAWCRLREDERTFLLGRIAAVRPVAG